MTWYLSKMYPYPVEKAIESWKSFLKGMENFDPSIIKGNRCEAFYHLFNNDKLIYKRYNTEGKYEEIQKGFDRCNMVLNWEYRHYFADLGYTHPLKKYNNLHTLILSEDSSEYALKGICASIVMHFYINTIDTSIWHSTNAQLQGFDDMVYQHIQKEDLKFFEELFFLYCNVINVYDMTIGIPVRDYEEVCELDD